MPSIEQANEVISRYERDAAGQDLQIGHEPSVVRRLLKKLGIAPRARGWNFYE